MDSEVKKSEFLECEKWRIFALLMAASGFFGAYTLILKGGVFCNAQTANFVLFAIALGRLDFKDALYYLIPMTAYLTGSMISEFFPKKVRRFGVFRWDTLLVLFEIAVVIALGFLPDRLPVQIFQVVINFICSMQYNTFRQAEKIPMATTFCTNHVRQTGIYIVKWLKKKDENSYVRRIFFHMGMIFAFILGGFISTVLCYLFNGRAIWGSLIFLMVAFIDLAHADLTKEKGLLNKIPSGH